VPVTASYIICAVIAGNPPLIKLGVPDFAAHMFIFYYAVLSEVSRRPPVAVRGRRDHWGRSVPHDAAVLEIHDASVPRALSRFVLDPSGVGLLLRVDQDAWNGRLGLDCDRHDYRRPGHRCVRRRGPGWALARTNVLKRGCFSPRGWLSCSPTGSGQLLDRFAVLFMFGHVRLADRRYG